MSSKTENMCAILYWMIVSMLVFVCYMDAHASVHNQKLSTCCAPWVKRPAVHGDAQVYVCAP